MNELPFSQNALRYLEALKEHPNAPNYNFESGDLLNRVSLDGVKRFEEQLSGHTFWKRGGLPEWMGAYLERIYATVPYYREYGAAPRDFSSIPPIGRGELAQHPELLVPDDVNLEGLTVYTTSGTTGTRLAVPTDPGVSSKVLVLMDSILSRFGLRLPRGAGTLAVAATFCQKETLTYASLSRYLQSAASVKINLHQACWRDAADPARFFSENPPFLVTGSPHSLWVLAELCPELRPGAVMSSAVSLSEGLRERLEQAFECPVIDVYSLTEAKFIAAKSQGEGHDLLSPDLYVEILDEEGRNVAEGERGEITLSGGRNRYLPLLRYRTGDFAALSYRGRQPYLFDFQGRPPVELRDHRGEPLSTLDVVHALRELPLVGFSFHQTIDLNYRLEYCGPVEPTEVENRVREITDLAGRAVRRDSWEGKPQQFSSGHVRK